MECPRLIKHIAEVWNGKYMLNYGAENIMKVAMQFLYVYAGSWLLDGRSDLKCGNRFLCSYCHLQSLGQLLLVVHGALLVSAQYRAFVF